MNNVPARVYVHSFPFRNPYGIAIIENTETDKKIIP